MRWIIAALALSSLAACASAPTPSSGGWSYGYDAGRGLATATQREPGGSTSATFTCRPPNGDLTITDYTLAGSGEATIRVGSYEMRASARSEGGRLVIALPQSPPALAAAVPGAAMSISAGGSTHALAPGAAERFSEVANACWQRGS